MSELELKFGVPHAALLSLRQALLDRGATPLRLRARYFDTPDGRLAAHRVALRLRQQDAEWVQTVKAEGESAIERLEHEVPVPAADNEVPALLLARHAGSAAHERLGQALGDGGEAQLVERMSTDVERLRLVLRDDGTEMEVALDVGQAAAGDASAPIAELEIEHLAGDVQAVFELGGAWVLHGGLWLSTISKAERAGRLLAPGAAAAAVSARPVTLPHHPTGAQLLRAVLRNTLAQVLANASEIAEGGDAAEQVHQLRVGLRRLRTVLRELHGLCAAMNADWEPELARVFDTLGRVRDNSAVAAAVQPLLEAAGAPLAAWPAPAAEDLRDAVRAPAFQVVLVELLGLSHAPDAQLSDADAPAAHAALRERLARLHAQVARDGRRFATLPLQDQHRVRKRLKRLRYLTELTQPLWPPKAVQAHIAALKPAQDALGHHNDLATAMAAFRALARQDARAWFAAGYLQAQLQQTARAAQQALRGVRKAKRFWAD